MQAQKMQAVRDLKWGLPVAENNKEHDQACTCVLCKQESDESAIPENKLNPGFGVLSMFRYK